MKKHIILSVNQNEDYAYFTPLTCWSWRQFGWEPVILFTGKINGLPKWMDLAFEQEDAIYVVDTMPSVRDSTVAQCSRLYASCMPRFSPDDILMLGDIDMLALSDSWVPANGVKVYNYDLTDFTEIPMCYVIATAKQWQEIMSLNKGDVRSKILHDLVNYPNANSDDFYKFWSVDQQILTDRLKRYGFDKITFINRGKLPNGYARGRVDRGAWTLDHPKLIDAHLMQQTHHSEEKIRKLFELLEHVWPGQDFQWFRDYTAKFRELTGHTR